MNHSPTNSNKSCEPAASYGTELDELVAEYLAAEQAGTVGALEDWLVRAGSRADAFRAFLSDHERMRNLLGGASTDENLADAARTGEWSPGGEPRVDLTRALSRGVAVTPNRSFGDYELLQEIARGGMGVVFRARHRGLNRIVALKMILSGEWATADDITRFQTEASAAAQLDHPGIVRIYEFGQHQGQHFYTMAFVDGPSLAARVRGGPLAPREAAAIVKRVAEAVAHAHSKGVVHRDLKPANVLLAKPDPSSDMNPVGTDGLAFEPKITDFGLAKRVTSERGLTMTGQAVGTPSYMSPEQAAGRTAEVGPASDIYSLGALLYELLTGHPPFRASTPIETLIQVVENQPAPLRLLNPALHVDLETICLKCLEKSPAHRYASAQALADDLCNYLAGDPIRARSANLVSRVTHALGKRRHEEEFGGWGRAVAVAGLIVFAAHLAIFTLESWDYGRLVSYWLPRTLMFALLFVLLWLNRPHSLLPTNAAERLVWALWGGLFISLASANAVLAAAHLPPHLSYALSAVLGGFCFFLLGSHLWGGCYAIGAAFFAAAPWLTQAPRTAPLWDGLLWGVALCVLGAHYWARSAPPTPTDQDEGPSTSSQ